MKDLVAVLICSVGIAVAQVPNPSPPELAGQYLGSVFKVLVYDNEHGNVPEEGTCFVVFQTGAPDNPTLYFLTAAHVVLGGEASDDTNIGRVTKIQVKYSNNGFWDVDRASVRVPEKWDSYYRDFALFKVTLAGRSIKTVPLSTHSPRVNDHFTALGFPHGLEIPTPINGTIQVEPGNGFDEPWFLADANLSPGTSGGPVFTEEGVFAMVQGRHKDALVPKFLVPISITGRFLPDYIPGFIWPNRPIEKLLQREVSSTYLEVNCLEQKSDTIQIRVPLKAEEELVSAAATFEQMDNLRAQEVKVIGTQGNTVTVRYTLVGSSVALFGCKGGGHATLRVVATIRQSMAH